MAGVAAASVVVAGSGIASARSESYRAQYASPSRYASAGQGHARHIMAGMEYHHWFSSGLQCVPFARDNSGIELSGNANTWWNGANGVYERGARPEVGSVLNFRSSGRMRLGHVAVVSNVLDSRNLEIDHANWSSRGSVRRNVRVVDVSAFNDWTAVRVALGSGDFGSVYPTYGFIYDRPDRGVMVANAGPAAAPSRIVLAAAPLDLRPAQEQVLGSLVPMQDEEVAEASDDTSLRHGRSEWHRGRSARSGHAYASTAYGTRYATNRVSYARSSFVSYRTVSSHASSFPAAHSHGVVSAHSPAKHGRHRT